MVATFLVRAEVGWVRLIDPNHVDQGNVHRQLLFDQADALGCRAKAEVACRRLNAAHPSVQVEAKVQRFAASNAQALLFDAEVVVDGTDNFGLRYEISDVGARLGKPWVWVGVVGATGLSMVVVPGESPCLRCVFPQAPDLAVSQLPEEDGGFGPIISVIGIHAGVEACCRCWCGRRLVAGRFTGRQPVELKSWGRSS